MSALDDFSYAERQSISHPKASRRPTSCTEHDIEVETPRAKTLNAVSSLQSQCYVER